MDRGAWRPSSRTLSGGLCLLFAALLWGATAPARVDATQSDLSFTSDSIWTADPTAARVHVLAVVSVTSHTADTGARRLYYDRIQLSLPPESRT